MDRLLVTIALLLLTVVVVLVADHVSRDFDPLDGMRQHTITGLVRK
jgi:hypothetical protein